MRRIFYAELSTDGTPVKTPDLPKGLVWRVADMPTAPEWDPVRGDFVTLVKCEAVPDGGITTGSIHKSDGQPPAPDTIVINLSDSPRGGGRR